MQSKWRDFDDLLLLDLREMYYALYDHHQVQTQNLCTNVQLLLAMSSDSSQKRMCAPDDLIDMQVEILKSSTESRTHPKPVQFQVAFALNKPTESLCIRDI